MSGKMNAMTLIQKKITLCILFNSRDYDSIFLFSYTDHLFYVTAEDNSIHLANGIRYFLLVFKALLHSKTILGYPTE